MLVRNSYHSEILKFVDKPLVKVVSGIRRCGKSVLMRQIVDLLLENGVSKDHIIYINFESFDFDDIKTAKQLYDFVKKVADKTQRFYFFFDEIQEIDGWEKAINAFLVDFDADIYITGSNSKLLSGELATYLAGRYIELHIYTLSFNEYLQIKGLDANKANLRTEFEKYLKFGGFPIVHANSFDKETAYRVVYDIYSSVILRDAVQRYNIRDIELFERVVKYVFDNIGSKFSAKKVADYFKNQQRKLDLNTVYNYLNVLDSAFVTYRVPRYDIRGKEILKTNEKFFLSDPSLLYALSGYKETYISGVLENLVFLELKRREYKVYVGKLWDKEVDFVAEKAGDKIYVQVTYVMSEEETRKREFTSLKSIKDNYPKYVVSMDTLMGENIDGIKHIHIADFLLMDKY